MRRAFALAGLVASVVTGCGDGPICQSDVFVAIQTSEIVVDRDTVAEGVQGDIDIRTSLAPGDVATLEVVNGDRVLETYEATVELGGYARFENVTVTAPSATLRARVDTSCGTSEDEVSIEVLAGTGCALTMDPLPEIVPAFANRGVYSTRTDPDSAAPGHQLSPTVVTRPGWRVELAKLVGDTVVLDEVVAGADGIAAFSDVLEDGEVTYRATCHGPGFSVVSSSTNLVVDLSPPVCRLVHPAPGSTITTGYDRDLDLPGIQVEVVAQIDGFDVDGEPTELVISPENGIPSTVPGEPVDATGRATFLASLPILGTESTLSLALLAHDHARNACSLANDYEVVTNGCDIELVGPTGTVVTDANGSSVDGSQVDLAVRVSPACVGRPVVASCGASSAQAIVGANHRAVVRVDACATSPCEIELACTATVSTDAGVETTAAGTIRFDNQGPITTVSLVEPAVPCSATITPAADIDSASPGVQVVARVTAPGAVTRQLDVTNGSGTVRFPAPGDVTITLGTGTNRLVGVGLDDVGNRGTSAQCPITVTP